jgi:choice-of-anchor C domain-containing protein
MSTLFQHRMRSLAVFAALLASIVAGFAVARADSFPGAQNGSFEAGAGPNTGDWWWHLWAPNSTIPGWTVVSGSVDLEADGALGWQASDGHRSVDLDGDFPGAIAQTMPTTEGTLYVVRFDLSGNPDPDTGSPAGWNAVKRVQVSATGSTGRVFSYDIVAHANTHADMKYEAHSYAFVATSASTTLEFQSLSTSGWWGPVLDHVRVDVFTTDLCKNGGYQSLSDLNGNSFKNQGDCVSFVATGTRNGAAQ